MNGLVKKLKVDPKGNGIPENVRISQSEWEKRLHDKNVKLMQDIWRKNFYEKITRKKHIDPHFSI